MTESKQRGSPYYVHIEGITTEPSYVRKSGPKAAASLGVRKAIGSIPLKQEVGVWVRSKKRFHRFNVLRDYDNRKRRGFSITRPFPSNSFKAPMGSTPASLLVPDLFKPAEQVVQPPASIPTDQSIKETI